MSVVQGFPFHQHYHYMWIYSRTSLFSHCIFRHIKLHAFREGVRMNLCYFLVSGSPAFRNLLATRYWPLWEEGTRRNLIWFSHLLAHDLIIQDLNCCWREPYSIWHFILHCYASDFDDSQPWSHDGTRSKEMLPSGTLIIWHSDLIALKLIGKKDREIGMHRPMRI